MLNNLNTFSWTRDSRRTPKLWLPKRENIYCIDAIPLLGTGKADLKSVRAIALEASQK